MEFGTEVLERNIFWPVSATGSAIYPWAFTDQRTDKVARKHHHFQKENALKGGFLSLHFEKEPEEPLQINRSKKAKKKSPSRNILNLIENTQKFK